MSGECPTCGKLFGVKRDMRFHHVREHGTDAKSGQVVCAYCFESIPRQADGEVYYCCPQCRDRAENGHTYGEGWNDEKREQVRESQDRCCAECGIHEDELDRHLDVHHILKSRSFNNSSHANHVSNLVGLCPDCHDKWEMSSPNSVDTPLSELLRGGDDDEQ